ncbi:hypothetical protein GGX14DRAFT_578220 [Mycena pura]|uniref:Uncharacterized protein n=1 Tax=Mycena pura TaxID=153505 RepID=A0AAD6UU34_9AGAR|nr:hypothetical protein GGX14DRAFT_578220 [Mycena pura]
MQLTLSKLFAFVVATQAIGIASGALLPLPATAVAASAAISPSPLDFSTGISCTNSNLGGSCGTNFVASIPSGCFNYVAPFNDAITSVQVNTGLACTFFVNAGCAGAAITITGTVNDLTNTSFNDALSSYECNSALKAILRVPQT